MTKVICFANNKGGSGKSTTCSSVGYALSKLGKRVLLIDGDMQLNLTLSYFQENDALEIARSGKNLYSAIKDNIDLGELIYHTDYEGVDVIPSSTLMSGVEYELFTKWQREFVLKNLLKGVKESGVYDYVLIDAPPTLGCWVMNILVASDRLIVPVEASPWGLFGLANMFDFVAKVREISPTLEILGVAITKADLRKNYVKQTLENLAEQDGIYVFNSVIHTDSSVEWAQDESKPVGSYKKSARAAKEYAALAEEILKRTED